MHETLSLDLAEHDAAGFAARLAAISPESEATVFAGFVPAIEHLQTWLAEDPELPGLLARLSVEASVLYLWLLSDAGPAADERRARVVLALQSFVAWSSPQRLPPGPWLREVLLTAWACAPLRAEIDAALAQSRALAPASDAPSACDHEPAAGCGCHTHTHTHAHTHDYAHAHDHEHAHGAGCGCRTHDPDC